MESGPAVASDAVDRAHRWGLGAFVSVVLVYVLCSLAFAPLLIGDGPVQAWVLALAVSAPTLAAAGLALLITKLRGNGPRTDLRLHWSLRDLLLGLSFGVGGLCVTVPASMIYLSIFGQDSTSAAAEFFSGVRTSWTLAVIVFLIVAFVAPLCEEIVFRGLLWGAVEPRWGRWVALTVTTVVFALAHFEFPRILLLLVIAIPLGLARLYSGGLVASIVAHQITNVLPGIVIMLGLTGALPTFAGG